MAMRTLGILVATALCMACTAEADPTGLPEPLARHQEAIAAAAAAESPEAPSTPVPTAITTCSELAAAAVHDPADAWLLLHLCPDTTASPAVLRQALLMIDSPAAAAAFVPRLAATPDLAGLAKLAALLPPEATTANATLPDPTSAAMSPVTDDVLAAVHLAWVAQTEAGLAHDQRTRATAYLARVHHEALAQLGYASLSDQPLPPFARFLSGRFVHFGRELCSMYWQRRVAGLERLFATTEAQLLTISLNLERTPHLADDALLAVERQRTRRHLQGTGVRDRLARSDSLQATVDDLLPLTHELDRLLDHGLLELAFQRALYLGATPPNALGLAGVAEFLRAELTNRDLGEYRNLLERRIDETTAQVPPPVQAGPGLPDRVALGYPATADVVATAMNWWAEAQRAEPTSLPQRRALARLVLAVQGRPDASARLLSEPDIKPLHPVLRDLLARHDSDSLTSLRIAATASGPDHDADVRRQFAVAARAANLQPR